MRAASGSMKRFSRSLAPPGLRSDSAVKMVRSRLESARARRKNSLAMRLGLPMPSGSASTTFLPTRRSASSTISPTSSNICGMAVHLHAQTQESNRMTLKKPALDPQTLEPRTGSGYPEPYRSRALTSETRRTGNALGLTKIGINQTTLPPGKESSMRHWHTHEEEFVYVLSGEVVLITDAGEQTLTPGMCAGFPLGTQDGHQLVNRGSVPAVYLEVSNRDADDCAF